VRRGGRAEETSDEERLIEILKKVFKDKNGRDLNNEKTITNNITKNMYFVDFLVIVFVKTSLKYDM